MQKKRQAEISAWYRDQALAMFCPKCGAKPDQPCTENGVERRRLHRDRMRAFSALREHA
ncbi:MAG TPA: hypothetical protein VH392_12475 [Sphingomicrobium sp.]|jgi:hypothetical protein